MTEKIELDESFVERLRLKNDWETNYLSCAAVVVLAEHVEKNTTVRIFETNDGDIVLIPMDHPHAREKRFFNARGLKELFFFQSARVVFIPTREESIEVAQDSLFDLPETRLLGKNEYGFVVLAFEHDVLHTDEWYYVIRENSIDRLTADQTTFYQAITGFEIPIGEYTKL